jgi:hypothetical protein
MDPARGVGLGALSGRTFGQLPPPKIINRLLISQPPTPSLFVGSFEIRFEYPVNVTFPI